MLYITTGNQLDSFTAYRVLHAENCPEQGLYLPIKLPAVSCEQLAQMNANGFSQTVADVLNLFFGRNLTGWDVEFAIGRNPVRMGSVGRKIAVAELWNNTEGSFAALMDRLYTMLCGQQLRLPRGNRWPAIAIRIAVAFGILTQLPPDQALPVDVAVAGGEFEAAIALWLARQMGLPLGKLLCGSNENCSVWDLLYKLQMDTCPSVVATDTPAMDQGLPGCLEYLIYCALGRSEAQRYRSAIAQKGVYHISQEHAPLLNRELFCAVVGKSRGRDIINSVYHTSRYLIDPYTALAYGAVQDYRAKTGENRMTLLFAEEKPGAYAPVISQATGLSAEQIMQG